MLIRSGAKRSAVSRRALTTLEALKRSPLYAEELGIDLASRNDEEYFRWFLASLLFGGRISEGIARRTYESFCRHGLTTPRRIIAVGWDFLVNPIMREGRYVNYDGRKSAQILRTARCYWNSATAGCRGSSRLPRDPRELEARLSDFYGVGPVTANIFLRELRPFLPNADPAPLPPVLSLTRRTRHPS